MKVLVAEDHPVTRKMLTSRLLKWGYEVISCGDGTEAWEILNRSDSPRLVVMDWMMPGRDGIDICRKIRKLAIEPYIYIILLTAKSRSEDIITGLDAGADDYVVKPFDPQELQVRVRAGSRVVQLQSDLIAALEASEFLASHDPLTRLRNRGAIMDTLQREIARAARESRSMGLIITDVDHFKRINDGYGHLAGDEVLREVGRRLTDEMRSYDAVGRYGGEEFLVVLPEVDASEAVRIAERLRKRFEENTMNTPEGTFNITLSFGVAVFDPSDVIKAEDLIRRADEALYNAKRLGRNRVEVWKPE